MSRIRECFTSRFDEGVIMEADFSQLEVVGLAILSGDEALKQDIVEGTDFHLQTGAWLTGTTYAELKKSYDKGDKGAAAIRQSAKEPNFLNQYGGGVKLMAKNTGIPVHKCQQFLDAYKDKYRGVIAYQEAIKEEIEGNLLATSKKTERGFPTHNGLHVSPTGRRYVFNQYDGRDIGAVSFSPTQMKNFPVQGFSTGDIVPEVLGRVYRELQSSMLYGNILLVGTVHDSIVADVKKGFVYRASDMFISIMENAPSYMEERYGIKIDVPLKADVKYGKTWAECK